MMDAQLLNLLLWQAIQIAILVTVTKLLLKFAGNTRPFLSHILWAVVLIKCVTPPLWSSPMGVFTQMANHVELSSLRSQDNRRDLSGAGVDETKSSAAESVPTVSTLFARVHVDPLEETALPAPVDSSGPIEVAHAPNESKALNLGFLLLVVWLGGAVLTGGFLFARLFAFFHRLRSLTIRTCPDVNKLTEQLTKRLRIRKSVHVEIVDGNIGPAVIGWFRPRVLLPEMIVKASRPNSLKLLITHELMHVRRGDLWWAGLQEIARCVWWFHPWVRHAAKSMEHETEKCCDQQTMKALNCLPSDYAKCLVDVLEKKHQLRSAPTFPGVRAIDVTTERLERIMRTDVKQTAGNQFWVWPCLLVACVVVLPGAGMVSAQTEQTEAVQAEDESTQAGTAQQSNPATGKSTSQSSELVDPNAAPVTPPAATQKHSFRSPQILPHPTLNPNHRIAKRADKAVPTLRTYSIKEVIKRLKDTGLDQQTAETQFLNMLPKIPDDGLGIDIQVLSENEIGQSTSTRRRAVIQNGNLILMAPEDVHREVAQLIRRSERFGFEQVLIQASLVLIPDEQWEALGIEWRPIVDIQKSPEPASEEPQAVPLLPSLPLMSAPLATLEAKATADDSNTRDSAVAETDAQSEGPSGSADQAVAPAQVSESEASVSRASVSQLSAHTSVQRFNRMEITVLDRNPTSRIVKSVEGVQVLSVPKLITLNGQSAAIEVGAKQQLISGYQSTGNGKGMEPLHEEVSVGTTMKLVPEVVDRRYVKLDVDLQLTRLIDAPQSEAVANRIAKFGDPIQALSETSIETMCNIPLGHTLAIGGLEVKEAGKTHRLLCFLQCDLVSEASKRESKPKDNSAASTSSSTKEPTLTFESGKSPFPGLAWGDDGDQSTLIFDLMGKEQQKIKLTGDVSVETKSGFMELRVQSMNLEFADGDRLSADTAIIRLRSGASTTAQLQGNVRVRLADREITADVSRIVGETVFLDGNVHVQSDEMEFKTTEMRLTLSSDPPTRYRKQSRSPLLAD